MNEYTKAYEGIDPYIFVSYAHRDSEKILPVIRELYNLKYRVWYDEGIKPGSEWPANITQHLHDASVVIVFVSKNSLNSENCTNEVMIAVGKGKKSEKDTAKTDVPVVKKIQISLDGVSKHVLLSEGKTINLDDKIITNLTNILDDELIGDGITGYQYSIDKKRSFNRWNVVFGLAGVLAVVFAGLLYGLYNGCFDYLLPSKQPAVQVVAPTASPQEAISINSNLIGSVLPVKFSSDEEKNAVYEILEWSQTYEMTYKDLIEMDWVTGFEIWDERIYDISFAVFLPNLEIISLYNSRITDLTSLIECPKLKVVQVTVDMIPIILPTPRSFEVEIT